jgi:signal transduction histidine kinase/DNA-binding response OmpR family regulator
MASEKYQELGNLRSYARALGNIGYVQRSLENYESAEKYFIDIDSIYGELKDLDGKSFAAYNLSVVYKNTGQLEKAIAYNLKGLEGYEQLGNKKRVSYCYYTMGEIYKKKENIQQALDSYRKSLDISTSVDDSVQIGYSSVAVAECYRLINQSGDAKQYLQRAMDVAKGINLDILAMDVHENLSQIYAAEGGYLEAYENLNRYAAIRDSLYTEEKRELGSDIEAKYQNEQKLKEIALLSSEKNLQALQLQKRVNERNGIIALALIVMIIAGLLYTQYRTKQQANRKLQELDRLKSNYFANISHEFRTPLTLIKGPIEQLEQNPGEQLDRATVKMIRRNATRVLQLVNQLLELSKIDEGNLKLEPTEGDVFKCLRAAAASFNSHAAQRHIDYKVQIPQAVLWASFDRDKLEKVVYNLLSNAFKFSDDGAVISFEVVHDKGHLQLQIADSGRGIPERDLPFIFDRFFQVDSNATREQEGSGIGLSLSKDLVELMDGTITATSEIDKGSFFVVHLPVQEIKTGETASPLVKPTAPAQFKPDTFELTKEDKRDLPHILLVEDNEDMRYFIKEQLIKFYKVKEAVNGEAGLKKAIANPPELIITDLMMPSMDGMELCKKLKTEVHTSHIPVIMLTAKAGMENKIEGLETGADDYLTKPFNGKELLARVMNLIEQRQKLRSLFSNKGVQIDPKKVTVTSVDQKFLEQVLALLEVHYSESDFGVPQMQKALAMSKTQLHRKLKALTNEAPGELLRNFRLKRAAHFLSQKADSVTQIAYKVGFNNLSYFAKCFKELYGTAPSAY